MKIIMLGPQGCGKGTQGKRLSDKFDIPHISTGDIFRDNIKNETPLGKEAKSYIDDGKLVPDELTNRLLKDALDGKEDFILDGYPRNISQAEFLDSFSDVDHAVEIKISDDETVRRLSGRYMCKSTGKIYNVNTSPVPRKVERDDEGNVVKAYDDDTGEELYHRDDDNSDAIRERLKEYHSKTAPLVDFYSKKGKLVTINGEQNIDDVFKDITESISSE